MVQQSPPKQTPVMSHINGAVDQDPPRRDVKNHILFEVSTEAANRGVILPAQALLPQLTATVGGIYSVIKSKAPVTTAEYGDRYCLIGPYNRASVRRRANCEASVTERSIGSRRGRAIDPHES